MDQKWLLQSAIRKQAGDIYAFGMVMYEILYRALPFPEKSDIIGRNDIIGRKMLLQASYTKSRVLNIFFS